MNRAEIKKAMIAQSLAARERREVPEININGEPLIAWFRPTSTGEMNAFRDRLTGNDPTAAIDLFIAKAENEDGTKIFRHDDRDWMLQDMGYLNAQKLLSYCTVGLPSAGPQDDKDADTGDAMLDTVENSEGTPGRDS